MATIKQQDGVLDFFNKAVSVDRWMDANKNTRYCSDGEKAWYYKGTVILKRKASTEIFGNVNEARVKP